MNKQTDDENIHIREVLEENRRLKKEQETIQKTTLFDCIQQGVALKGKYENLKQEYGELLKENEALKRADTIADLESQIMHLRNEYRKLKHRHGLLHDECLELEIKNDDLKQWQKEVFEVIDEKIKEADKGFEQTHDEWYQGQVDALKELKKELQKNDT